MARRFAAAGWGFQEPTDYTLRTERTTPRGNPVPDLACHQGVGFAAAVVVSGAGRLDWAGGGMAVRQGDTLFLPARCTDMNWTADHAEESLKIVLCFPPAAHA